MILGFPGGTSHTELTCQHRKHKRRGFIPGGEDPLEEKTATPSSILAWRIHWTEEPGGLQPLGSQRAGHDRSNLARTHSDIIILWVETALSTRHKKFSKI